MASYVPPANDVEESDVEDVEEVEDSPPKKAKVSKQEVREEKPPPKAKGKAKAKATASAADEADIPSGVLARAEKANIVTALRKLLVRDDIKSANISAEKALVALEEAGGLLHPARRALLGA